MSKEQGILVLGSFRAIFITYFLFLAMFLIGDNLRTEKMRIFLFLPYKCQYTLTAYSPKISISLEKYWREVFLSQPAKEWIC